MQDKIISLIKDNRISTTEVADVLGKTGCIENILPVNRGQFFVGELVFVYALNNSNWEVHEQLHELNVENKIVYVHGINCDRAIFGDLVSKYILLYKKAKAIVVNGKVRDAHTLIKEKYPIWATGVSPIGCTNVKNDKSVGEELYRTLKAKYDGGILVCDDSGVVLIPDEKIDETLIEKLNFIEYQEDIWFFCLDTHKMSTYEIVCQKQYLTRKGLLDEKQLVELSKFSTAK
jgi:regulator of RNase E activity RraA